MKITQIQFRQELLTGSTALATVFTSLPQKGEENAWLSHEAASQFCEAWPVEERGDVGGYYTPSVPSEPEDGVTTIVTPSSGREVSYFPKENLWTVDFGPEGSVHAAGQVLAAISVEPTNIAILR